MLIAEEITKQYWTTNGDVVALDEASLTLSPGERVGLVGPSGSGKSTLAQILALVMPPDSGTLTIDDTKVSRWGIRAPRELRRRVQLIWQAPRLATDPRLRLRQIIAEPMIANGLLPKNKNAQSELLAGWAERAGLTEELLERQPHEVSDGQLQRACLVRALVLNPGYLICDEVSSMLDVSTQASLLNVIAEQQKVQNFGVLLISHDQTLIKHWCGRVVELSPSHQTAPSSP